jgi:hypothetical protein
LEKGACTVSEYIFKLKKGDLELELRSDDAKFIEMQMENWRNTLVNQQERH